jgi:hypothetical protein
MTVAIEPPREGYAAEFGVIYVAFGAPYLAMTLVSALSLRITNPTVAICVVTNVREVPPALSWWDPLLGDRWVWVPRDTKENRLLKTDVYRLSPFALTLFLDCDTMVVGSLDRIPLFLERWDVLLRMVAAPCKYDGHHDVLPARVPFRDVTHFNSGVVGFRRTEATREFFELWQERHLAMDIGRDQPPLIEALFASSVRVLPLRVEWNLGDFWKWSAADRRRAVIWHYKSRSPDRRVDALTLRVLDWFDATVAERADVARFVGKRRWVQNRGLLLWRIKAWMREFRGALSAIPERQAGSDRWRELTTPVSRTVSSIPASDKHSA